jgi:hypothetical protein
MRLASCLVPAVASLGTTVLLVAPAPAIAPGTPLEC